MRTLSSDPWPDRRPHRDVAASRHATARGLAALIRKSLRDARWPGLAVAGLASVMLLGGGDAMMTTYGQPGTRAELAAMAAAMPDAFRGIYGNPINVDTLGGFVSWHYGSYLALIAGLWSILALSSTLAGEARRGSLDLVAAAPLSRRWIAAAKAGAHVVAMLVVAGIMGVAAWLAGTVFAMTPRDHVAPEAAAAFAAGVAVRALAPGAIAFALSSFVGRASASAIAGVAMLGGYVAYGYRSVVGGFDALAGLTWWSWAAGHVPLAGPVDWTGVGATALLVAILLGVGIEAFGRRDIGVVAHLPTPAPPTALLGVRDPVRRAVGELLPSTAWWAVGLAVYGALMAVAANALVAMLASAGGMAEALRTILPGTDMSTTGGFLQLAFVDLGCVVIGLAAATFVAGSWGDESGGRLEVLLATPLSRARWAVSASLGALVAIAMVTIVLAAAIAVAIASAGEDALAVAPGVGVLGLYAAALAGVGMAAGGLLGARAAAPVVAGVAIGTFLLDTLAPILRLPDWVAQLALTTHLGAPLAGSWEPAGLLACIAIAVAGTAVGAWGMARRDVAG